MFQTLITQNSEWHDKHFVILLLIFLLLATTRFVEIWPFFRQNNWNAGARCGNVSGEERVNSTTPPRSPHRRKRTRTAIPSLSQSAYLTTIAVWVVWTWWTSSSSSFTARYTNHTNGTCARSLSVIASTIFILLTERSDCNWLQYRYCLLKRQCWLCFIFFNGWQL